MLHKRIGDMDRYSYTEEEKEINKVFKMHEKMLDDVAALQQMVRNNADKNIKESEFLLKSLSINPQRIRTSQQGIVEKLVTEKETFWSEIAEEANTQSPGDVHIEDILTSSEMQIALDDLESIKNEFSSITKLDKNDIAFLFVAIALQTLRWVLMPKIGNTIDKSKRLNHDDKSIKDEINKKNKDFQDKNKAKGHRESEKGYKSWEQIVFNSVPYDATRDSGNFDVKMEGGYHRYKTFGHDPILGWIFGTANIITDTITLTDFSSYRVEKMKFAEPLVTPEIFVEAFESIQEDKLRLAAGIFAQAVHLSSDKYTKLGLPIPLLEVFSEDLAKKLYYANYDTVCLEKDLQKISSSTFMATLINTTISIVHSLFYNEEIDVSRELYEVKTRKILLLSNIISSTSNIITSVILKNPKMLDVGGLIVAIGRLFSDGSFILRIQDEFINNKLDEGLVKQLNDVDELYNEIVKRHPTTTST